MVSVTEQIGTVLNRSRRLCTGTYASVALPRSRSLSLTLSHSLSLAASRGVTKITVPARPHLGQQERHQAVGHCPPDGRAARPAKLTLRAALAHGRAPLLERPTTQRRRQRAPDSSVSSSDRCQERHTLQWNSSKITITNLVYLSCYTIRTSLSLALSLSIEYNYPIYTDTGTLGGAALAPVQVDGAGGGGDGGGGRSALTCASGVIGG